MKFLYCAVLVAVFALWIAGCAPRYTGPEWTYYTDEQFEPKPENFAPEIFFSSDVMQQARTSDVTDDLLVPPHVSIASAAGRGLTLGEVVAKARELGADGVIVTRIGKAGFLPGGGSVDLGREVAGATFIRYQGAAAKRDAKSLFER